MGANRSLTDLIARVSAMSAAEISDRLRQEAGKRLDLVRYRLSATPGTVQKRKRPIVSVGNFFFDSPDIPEIISVLRKYMPAQAHAVVAEAEQICAHRFCLLGYRDLQFGADIDC